MTLVTEPFLNLEDIQRQVFLTLFDELNNNIDVVTAATQERDRQFYEHIQRDYTPLEVEHIANQDFHQGNKPSLLEAPITAFPNCSCWIVRALPTNESSLLDQVSIKRNLIYIEVMVRSTKDESEANQRLLRTTEAAHLCIEGNETINGLVTNVQSEPTISISDVFVMREGGPNNKTSKTTGKHWFMQGARLEFTLDKSSVKAENNFIPVEQVTGPARIDYSKFIDQ